MRQPGLLGSAEPGLSMIQWGLGGFQGLQTSVAELYDGAQSLREPELWCLGETSLSMDPSSKDVNVTMRHGDSDMLLCVGILVVLRLLAVHKYACSPGSKIGFPVSFVSAWISA